MSVLGHRVGSSEAEEPDLEMVGNDSGGFGGECLDIAKRRATVRI